MFICNILSDLMRHHLLTYIPKIENKETRSQQADGLKFLCNNLEADELGVCIRIIQDIYAH